MAASKPAIPAGPPKKRRRQTEPQPAPPATSTSSAPPPQPASTPAPAPVLSAVAARRAAAAAAAAQKAVPAPRPAVAQPNSDDEQEEEDEQAEDSDSSASASDIEAALLVEQKQDRQKRNAKQPKRKEKKPSRYFGGAQEDEDETFAAEEAELRMDEDQYGTILEEVQDPMQTPRPIRTRRRREKTAFVDPSCRSNFSPAIGTNAIRTTVQHEDGSSVEGVLYALRAGDDLVIHGAFDLTLVYGSVTVLGATLSASPAGQQLPVLSPIATHSIFSPSSHPLPPIAALPSAVSSDPTARLDLPNGSSLDLSLYAAVLLVTDHQTGIEGIELPLKSGGLGCASGMFPAPAARRSTGNAEAGTTWRLIIEPVPALALMRELEPWSAALSSFAPLVSAVEENASSIDPGRLVVMVEGPKRAGKSTFARTLMNRLLDRYEAVAYLDTDLGQPEFSVPGFLSLNVVRKPLLGPSFTHLAFPVSSHYFGSASPASDPSGYLAAISSLLSTYSLEVEYPLLDEPVPSFSRRRHHGAQAATLKSSGKIRERVPLVVNTQGWVKGLGADLLAKLKAESQPTHVCSFVMVDEEGAAQGYDGGAAYARGQADAEQGLPYHLITLPSAPPTPLESKWTAADLRALSFVSYFHSVFIPASSSPSSAPHSTFPVAWNFASPLLAQSPYVLDWTAAAQQISSVHLLNDDDIAYELVLHALNGSIVALVEETPQTEDVVSTKRSPVPYDPLSPRPSPCTSRAIGLALIRSISPASCSLHLLTPVPPPSGPVALVKGALELPLPLMLDYGASEAEREKGIAGVAWREVPFLSVEEGEYGGRRRVRRNLMRRGHA
ncbi:hypothetical protein JCM21900_000626 [Sporobolomyces salmonicolor]